MNLLLDTTIQIDRITGSKERKRAIMETLKNHKLFCSSYVKGEYYSNTVNDLVTLFGLFLIDRDTGETGKRITERVFGRSQSRMSKLYANILVMCNFNPDEIEDTFYLYIDLIQDEFMTDIEVLLDTTECARADREVKYEDGIPYLPAVHCTKNKNICNICYLWEQFKEQTDKLIKEKTADQKILDILTAARDDAAQYKGRNCMTLGDLIISLEALNHTDKLGVCSSNRKDFQPLCDSIGVDLAVPDYSWKCN